MNRFAYYSIATHWHHIDPECPSETLCGAATLAMRKAPTQPEGLQPCGDCSQKAEQEDAS